MSKKKTLMIRADGRRLALMSYRKMIVRNALTTLYNTKDLKQLYVAKDILYSECRKAFYENWLRLQKEGM